MYAFLVSTMPRDGGDYTFQSRLLGGAAGAVFAFAGVVVGGALWVAIAGWFASRIAVGPLIVLTGRGLTWSAGRGGELGDVDGRSRVHWGLSPWPGRLWRRHGA